MGEIPSGTGIDNQALDFYFDFGFTPSLPQSGTSPQVIFSPKISGLDTFTNTRVESGVEGLDTSGIGGPVVE